MPSVNTLVLLAVRLHFRIKAIIFCESGHVLRAHIEAKALYAIHFQEWKGVTQLKVMDPGKASVFHIPAGEIIVVAGSRVGVGRMDIVCPPDLVIAPGNDI